MIPGPARYAFSLHPDRFSVTVFIPRRDDLSNGADYLNDGVQGASPVFYNTFAMFDKLRFRSSPVGIQVSRVINRFRVDIQKLDRVLKIIGAFEPLNNVFQGLRSNHRLPARRLFFGTGNQTPFISSAILARVFMDRSMRIASLPSLQFEYSSLASIPEIRSLSEPVTRIVRGSQCVYMRPSRTNEANVQLWSHSMAGTDSKSNVRRPCGMETSEDFDELILAVDADSALKTLGENASCLEKKVLGNVKYVWDVSIMHCDLDYMDKVIGFARAFFASPTTSFILVLPHAVRSQARFFPYGPRCTTRIQPCAENVCTAVLYPELLRRQEKVEMSFDLTNYQPQVLSRQTPRLVRSSPRSSSKASTAPSPFPPLSSHV
ncbi:hypothetical protein JVU11DRAFT_10274 [Chiua virens]|nr:hypothetical protein JVU11DRAFT_10274 [Chiua virens]